MTNTPKIRFKNFSDEWVERKADEICTIETGKSNTQDQNDNGKYPFYIRSDKPVRSNKFLYDCEAVITIGDGSIGKVFHYVKGKFDLHQRCYKMTDFKDVTGKYFYYYFSTKFYDRAMKMTAKATVDSVRLEMISDMFFSIPNNLAEQCKISEFFTKLDKLITLHQSKFEQLQKIKKSCLQNLFPQNNQNTPKIRFKNFNDEWVENKLGEISERITRKNSNLETTLPLTISSQYGLVDQSAYFNNRVASLNLSKYYLIKNGEFAYNKSYSDGFPYGSIKRLDNYSKGALSTLYIIFAIKNAIINSNYLQYFYNTKIWHNDVAMVAAEGARNHGLLNITAQDFFTTNVKFPSNLQEQEKIGAFFSKLDKLITLHQSKFEKLQKIKKSCLQNMFV